MTSVRNAWQIASDMLFPPDDDWSPLPHQMPPPGNWFVWLLMGGRGIGKTATASRHLHEHVMGPPCLPNVPGGHWVGIIGPTLGDAVTSCALGPSGLRMHDPELRVRQTAGGTGVRWSNGAEGKIFGAHTPEDVERLRSGGNRCIVWAEELAAWRYMEECWQHMRYGLRVGPHPHAIVSTTPKNRKLIRDLRDKALSGFIDPEIGELEVVMTNATTAMNPHLSERVRRMLYEDYGGTRLGRQELYGEILEDVEGALWKPSMIDDHRLDFASMPRQFDKIVVAVDPAVSAGGDEWGIIVVAVKRNFKAKGSDPFAHLPHGFVLGDYSIQGTPHEAARAVAKAYRDWEANLVVAEVNNGGDLVASTLRTINSSMPIKNIHASRGKARRAEPVVSLYEQGRFHHVGQFGKLEDQMTGWDADDPDPAWSPDRMDALVWGAHELIVSASEMRRSTITDTRLRGRR